MEKVEISLFEQFLLFLQCFQMESTAEESECVCMRERVSYMSSNNSKEKTDLRDHVD